MIGVDPMAFEKIREALTVTLTSEAESRFSTDTFQRQSHAAEEVVGQKRHVSVFYRSGTFDKSRSGWLQGPHRHAMTFAVELLLAAPAKVDLRVIQDPTATSQALMSALSALQEAGDVANLAWDELARIVWQILMDPRNENLGFAVPTISERWISNVQKETPSPMGEYVLLTGTMDYTCTGVEVTAGETGVDGEGIDVTQDQTADVTGSAMDSAKQGAEVT